MIALAAARRAFHLAQQRVHFIAAETAASPHRMVAGHRRENMIEPLFERRDCAVVLAKCYGEIANERRRVAAFQQSGHFMHRDRARAERLDNETEFREKRARVLDPFNIGLSQFDDRRNEQRLARDVLARAGLLQALVYKPLMRGVLIDDDDAIAGLGDYIGIVDLRPRGAERRFEIFRRGWLLMRTRVGGKRLANERKIAKPLRCALGKTRIGRRLHG